MTEKRGWLVAFSLAAGLMGLGAFVLTTYMNYSLGTSLGSSDTGQMVQGASAVIVDLAVLVLGLAAGLALRARRWGIMALTVLLLLPCAVYSFGGVVGFGAKERIAKSRAIEAVTSENRQAVSKANADMLAMRRDFVDWLKGSTQETGSRKAKATFLGEATKVLVAPVEVKVAAAVPSMALADPQAEVLGEFFAVDPDNVQKGLITFLAGLLVSIKAAGFFLASALWPAAVRAEASEAEEVSDAPDVVEDAPVEPAKASAEVVGLEDARVRKFIARFFKEALVSAKGNRVAANTMHGWYLDWARSVGGPDVTLRSFGTVCKELQIRKSRSRYGTSYHGFNKMMAAPQLRAAV